MSDSEFPKPPESSESVEFSDIEEDDTRSGNGSTGRSDGESTHATRSMSVVEEPVGGESNGVIGVGSVDEPT